jgi:uncharacterized repeat protein (TIGR01451 family)
LGKQVSKPQAQGGDTLTYTLGVTFTTGSLAGVTVTDTLPAGVSFISLGTPSSGSATYLSGPIQIEWALPNPLTPGSYTLTYQTQVGLFTAGGTSLINNAQLTAPSLASPLTASVTVGVTGSILVRIGIYNEAGELIKTLKVCQVSKSIQTMDLQGNTITRLNGPGSLIQIYCQDILFAQWDGTDDSGNPVTNGVYNIKLDNVDAVGVVTTLTQQATVSRSLSHVTLEIYNEAGEIIRHLYAQVDDPLDGQMTYLTLSTGFLQPGGVGDQPTRVQISVDSSTSCPITLWWDGTNDAGSPVTPGNYLLCARWSNGQGQTSVISKTLLVSAGVDRGSGNVTAQPNRLLPLRGLSRVNFLCDSTPEMTLRVRIYAMSGEFVASSQGEAGGNHASWDASGVASGLYLAVVDKLSPAGGLIGRQTLKILEAIS